MINIAWNDKRWKNKKGSQLFEELCYDLLSFEGFDNIEWREGSYDGGRDIQAEKAEVLFDKTRLTKKYWIQCKRYKKGVSLKDIETSLRKAENNGIDYFLIMTSSHLTPTLLDDIKANNKTHELKILDFGHKKLEENIIKHKYKFPDLNKYFFDKSFDKDQEVLAKLNKRRISFEKELARAKVGNKILLNTLIQLSTQYYELRYIKDAIDLIKISEKYFNDNSLLVELKLKLGEIYLKLKRGRDALILFDDIKRNINLQNNSKYTKIIDFYYAHSKFLCFDYKSSVEIFQQIKNHFLSKPDKVKNKFIFVFVDLLIEINEFKEADKYLKLIRDDQKINSAEKILKQLIIFNKRRDWISVEQIFKKKKEIFTRNKEMYLKILYEFAFAFWKLGKIDKALIILEEDCLNIIKELNVEEYLIVLFQNISLLRMELEPFSEASWEYYDKSTDVYNRLRSRYFSALIKGLYSSESLVYDNFADSLESLRESQRIFEDINSWQNTENNISRLGILYYKAGDLFVALHYFVKKANEEKIKICANRIINYYDTDKINEYCKILLNNNNLIISEKIGICYLIENFAEVLDNNNIWTAISLLIMFGGGDFSFTKAYDLRRHALKTLFSNIYLIPKEFHKKIYSLLKNTYNENDFGETKELVAEIFEELIKNNFCEFEINEEIEYWGNIYLNNHKTVGKFRHILENILYLLIENKDSAAREKVCNMFKSTNNFRNINVAHKLNWLKKESIELSIKNSLKMINESIIIEDNIDTAPKLEMKDHFFSESYILENKRITVGGYNGLISSEIINAYELNETLIEELILTYIKNILNKYNLLINREVLLNHITGFKIPCKLVNKIFALIETIFNGRFELTETDISRIKNSNSPFSRSKITIGSVDAIISNTIYLAGEKYNQFDATQKSFIKNKLLELNKRSSLEILKACAYTFRFIEVKDLESFLFYYQLLNSSEAVGGFAIYSLYKSNHDNWNQEYYIAILKYLLDSLANYSSYEIKKACAILFKNILEVPPPFIDSQLTDRVKNACLSLKSDKFYSVRKELEGFN